MHSAAARSAPAGDWRPPAAWWWVAAATFPAFFVLLLICDLHRPALSGLVLAFDRDALVVRAVDAGPAADAGLQTGDRIVRAAGQPMRSRLDLLAIEYTLRFDEPLTLNVVRGTNAAVVTVPLPAEPAGYWRRPEAATLLAIRFVQAVALCLGLLVLWRRPADAAGRLGAWLLLTCGVVTVELPYRAAAVWRSLPAPVEWALWLPYVSSLCIGALLFSFFAAFPRPVLRGRWLWAAAWAPMALALVWPVWFMGALLTNPAARPGPSVLAALVLVANAGYLTAGLVLLVAGARRATDAGDRRRARILLIGGVVALVVGLPIVSAYWIRSGAALRHSLFTSPVLVAGTLALLLVPLAFAYATLRHRLFDIPVLLRVGLQYALARRVLLSTVPVMVTALSLDLLINADDPVAVILARRGWLYAGLAALAIVARVKRCDWLEALDRKYFRERYSAEHLLREVADQVRQAADFRSAAESVCVRIENALHPTHAAVLTRRSSATAFSAAVVLPPSLVVAPLGGSSALVRMARALAAPMTLSRRPAAGLSAQLPRADRDWLDATGIELVVPIALAMEPQGRHEALLALGPRRSEEPYTASELELLGVIGDALSLVFASSGDDGLQMAECAECGRCLPAGESRCPRDGNALRDTGLPHRLASRYRLERRLAEGGMGVVYEALDLELFDRPVAIKFLREELARDDDAKRRFEHEARALAALSHPHIVPILGYGVTQAGTPYLVMERLTGTSLREALDADGAFGPGRATSVLRGVAAALDAAHGRGIVHRDLKPENVFLIRSGRLLEHAVVLDFGLAQMVDAVTPAIRRRRLRRSEMFGTPGYMAPEQLAGEEVTAACDIWAFMVVCREVLTGRLADDDTACPLTPQVARVFTAHLGEDPASRPASAAAFVDVLEDALETLV